MSLKRSVLVVILAPTLALTALTACKTSQKKSDVPLPDFSEAPPPPAAARDAHLEEVKKNAATQLECPIEQVNTICLRRHADGDCVAVRADGCDKSYEYDFGDN